MFLIFTENYQSIVYLQFKFLPCCRKCVSLVLFYYLQVHKYVVVSKDYITRESTLLSFRKGDVIKLLDAEIPLERGRKHYT